MTEVERPLSALSVSSSTKSDIDWDRSTSGGPPPVTPSPRRRHIELPPVERTPMANRPRSLADLLRLHAEKGNEEDVNLTAEEERRLREALDNWVNGEDDDASFKHPTSPDSSSDEEGARTRLSRSRSNTLVGSEPRSPKMAESRDDVASEQPQA